MASIRAPVPEQPITTEIGSSANPGGSPSVSGTPRSSSQHHLLPSRSSAASPRSSGAQGRPRSRSRSHSRSRSAESRVQRASSRPIQGSAGPPVSSTTIRNVRPLANDPVRAPRLTRFHVGFEAYKKTVQSWWLCSSLKRAHLMTTIEGTERKNRLMATDSQDEFLRKYRRQQWKFNDLASHLLLPSEQLVVYEKNGLPSELIPLTRVAYRPCFSPGRNTTFKDHRDVVMMVTNQRYFYLQDRTIHTSQFVPSPHSNTSGIGYGTRFEVAHDVRREGWISPSQLLRDIQYVEFDTRYRSRVGTTLCRAPSIALYALVALTVVLFIIAIIGHACSQPLLNIQDYALWMYLGAVVSFLMSLYAFIYLNSIQEIANRSIKDRERVLKVTNWCSKSCSTVAIEMYLAESLSDDHCVSIYEFFQTAALTNRLDSTTQ